MSVLSALLRVGTGKRLTARQLLWRVHLHVGLGSTLLSVVCGAHSAFAQPAIHTIASTELRTQLGAEGVLVEHGERGKNYVGYALGRRVTADGDRVLVTSDPIGEEGIVLREGYLELNLGAHLEGEGKFLIFAPTAAVDAAITAKIWIDGDWNPVVHVLPRAVEGDNLGGKVAASLAHGRLSEVLHAEVAKKIKELAALQQKEHHLQGALFYPRITTKGIELVLGRQPAAEKSQIPKAREFLCHERDYSGAPLVRVIASQGAIDIASGELKEIPVVLDADGWFFWHSVDGEDVSPRDRTRPVDKRTNVVVAFRVAGERQIDWFCYREVP